MFYKRHCRCRNYLRSLETKVLALFHIFQSKKLLWYYPASWLISLDKFLHHYFRNQLVLTHNTNPLTVLKLCFSLQINKWSTNSLGLHTRSLPPNHLDSFLIQGSRCSIKMAESYLRKHFKPRPLFHRYRQLVLFGGPLGSGYLKPDQGRRILQSHTTQRPFQ